MRGEPDRDIKNFVGLFEHLFGLSNREQVVYLRAVESEAEDSDQPPPRPNVRTGALRRPFTLPTGPTTPAPPAPPGVDLYAFEDEDDEPQVKVRKEEVKEQRKKKLATSLNGQLKHKQQPKVGKSDKKL